jgi:hypothetical protein
MLLEQHRNDALWLQGDQMKGRAGSLGTKSPAAEKADMGRLLVPQKRAFFLVWREVA